MSGNFINNPNVLVPQPQPGSGSKKNRGAGSQLQETTETTDVYYWYFEDGASESAIPSFCQNMPCLHNGSNTESIVNAIDGRIPVDIKDYQAPGGKYRAIVKLFLLYDGQVANGVEPSDATWAIATGWLVAGDMVVTAGHCAYDWSRNLGRLIKVKAYLGYTGSDSIGSEWVEYRHGIAVVTTKEWMTTDGGYEPRDVSFIKLSSAFSKVSKYYKWEQTPVSQDNVTLGVVGYPGDLVDGKGERGATMYQMFKKTTYNLENSSLHMLPYQIDTYGGNSGSPVFNDSDTLSVIGVHVLGGYGYNSASVITGPYGNRFQAYYNITNALDGTKSKPEDSTQPDPTKPWLWMCHAKTTESLDEDPVKVGLNDTITKAKTVHADIPNTILDTECGLCYGSSAGPQIGILSHAAIAAAGRLAADSVHENNVEALTETRAYDGVLGRAIIAECALECFYELAPPQQETFSESLGPIVAALKPFVMRVAPRILKGVLEPGMRLLLSNMKQDLDTSDKRTTRSDAAESDTGFGRKLTDQESAFVDGLMGKVDHSAVESFFSTLSTIGDVVGSAFKKAGPVLLDVAKVGLPLLLGRGPESLWTPPSQLDPLAHRAILAEACLQAYVAMPESDARKKGIYAKIISKVKNLGPKLMKAAPFVVKHVGPIVADMLREVHAKDTQEFGINVQWP